MKIILAGTDYFSLNVANQIQSDLVAVLSIGNRIKHRGMKQTSPELVNWAEHNHIPAIQSDNLNRPEFEPEIKSYQPDLLVVASFGKKIPSWLIDLPTYGGINIHPSLLPKYRGMAPVTRAIMNGDKITGVTIHKLTAKIDAGEIISQTSAEIDINEDDYQLKTKLAVLGGKMIKDILPGLARGNLTYTPQDKNQVSYAPGITKEDRVINWNSSNINIYNQVRALHPQPLAVTSVQEKIIEVVQVGLGQQSAELSNSQLPPGTLLSRKNPEIMTGSGTIRLLKVKPASRKIISGQDLINGFRLKPGVRFR
ncbi:MAG: hypothetical protein APR63_01960 [Desulfuromonas sp. SDB]|nr:MAG: hypothetical protein APR63_01960 [Desulfuromonas sp. SDB]